MWTDIKINKQLIIPQKMYLHSCQPRWFAPQYQKIFKFNQVFSSNRLEVYWLISKRLPMCWWCLWWCRSLKTHHNQPTYRGKATVFFCVFLVMQGTADSGYGRVLEVILLVWGISSLIWESIRLKTMSAVIWRPRVRFTFIAQSKLFQMTT